MADRVGGGSPHASREQIEAGAEAIWTEVDGPLAVGPEVQGHERNLLRAEACLSAAATARPDPDWEKVARELYEILRAEYEVHRTSGAIGPLIAYEKAASGEKPVSEQRQNEASLAATILGWQELWDDNKMTDDQLVSNIMHLDVDTESEPGEILELRQKLAQYEGPEFIRQSQEASELSLSLAREQALREHIHRHEHRAAQPMDKCHQCAALSSPREEGGQ